MRGIYLQTVLLFDANLQIISGTLLEVPVHIQNILSSFWENIGAFHISLRYALHACYVQRKCPGHLMKLVQTFYFSTFSSRPGHMKMSVLGVRRRQASCSLKKCENGSEQKGFYCHLTFERKRSIFSWKVAGPLLRPFVM